MATITVNLPAASGSYLHTLSRQLEELAADIADIPSGGTNVLTIDNAPAAPGQLVSFSLTAGPNTGKKKGN